MVNQSECYITTAGYRDSYAYARLIELMAESILTPDEVFIMGGTYKIPVNEGLQPQNFIENLKLQGTFEEESFEREWCSKWTGDSEMSYFSSEAFDKCRELLAAEWEFSNRSSKTAYYVLGVDVGRKHDTTEVTVIKVTPQPQGAALKSVVCFYSREGGIMQEQALWLKKLYYKYKARILVIDANGLGIGLIDDMVLGQIDPETNDYYPPFGVEGGNYENAGQEYKKYRTEDMERDAMYLIKANAPLNTEAHAYVRSQMGNGKVKLLIEEREARNKLMETKVGQNLKPNERNERLIPFQLTDNLKIQMMNLVQKNDGVNTILRENNTKISKDRFSSFEYGMYYIKLEEERKKKKKTINLSDLMFFT